MLKGETYENDYREQRNRVKMLEETMEVGDEVKSSTVADVKETTVSRIAFSQELFKSHGSSHFITSLKPFEILQASSAIQLLMPFPFLSD